MAQPATNPKIEELRARVKSEPKSRLFYQLAEELRKVRAYAEAEEVLRGGLTHNPTYLAAWVSLGRVLREEDKHRESVDAFTKALQLDPGNVVAARLMADAYLDLGDKVEAIKKYKLCRALLPVDEELDATIERLEDEINPVVVLKPEAAPEPAQAPAPPPAPEPAPAPPSAPEPEPIAESTQPAAIAAAAPVEEESPFESEEQPFASADAALQSEAEREVATGDIEPMREAHDESPFEEPVAAYSAAAVELEQPLGMHVEAPPLAAEVPAPWPEEEPAADVFEPAPQAPPLVTDDAANTITMADLYVKQGFIDRAQSIYESILERDPNNDAVRTKLDELDARATSAPPLEPAAPARNSKVERLEGWLTKVKRGEAGRV